MTRHVKKAKRAVRRSYWGKMVPAIALIAAGIVTIQLGSETVASLLVMAGLTLGGWSQGLHAPMPNEDEEPSDE